MRQIPFPLISEGPPPKDGSPRDFCYQWAGLFWNEWFVTTILRTKIIALYKNVTVKGVINYIIIP